MRGSWRPNKTATYRPPLLWPQQRFFPVLLCCSTGGLGAQPLWVLVFSTASYLQLVWSPIADFLSSSGLYNNLTSTESLPITGQWYATSAVYGIACFDHHRAEITLMQFTGHPLPVHQFVTVPWDFDTVPYFQPSLPSQSLPITGQRNMQLPPSLEWYVWPGRRSIYNTRSSAAETVAPPADTRSREGNDLVWEGVGEKTW